MEYYSFYNVKTIFEFKNKLEMQGNGYRKYIANNMRLNKEKLKLCDCKVHPCIRVINVT